MVNRSNRYAEREQDLAAPVARSPQIRAQLGDNTTTRRCAARRDRRAGDKSETGSMIWSTVIHTTDSSHGTDAMSTTLQPKLRDPFLLPVCDCGGPMNLAS